MSIINYIKETRTEMTHVKWPTMQQAFAFTLIIIILCLILAALLGFFDYIFGLLVQMLLNLNQ